MKAEGRMTKGRPFHNSSFLLLPFPAIRRDLHPDLRAHYVLANPPFNDSDWPRKDDDVRWQKSEQHICNL